MSNTTMNARPGVQIHTHLKPALDHATVITRQAQRWAAYALERGTMRPAAVYRKAQDSVDFSLTVGANTFAVPSKLTGTRDRQEALGLLHELRPIKGHRLDVTAAGEGLVVSFAGMQLGLVQSKHVPWIRPLLEHGASVHLLQITGTDDPKKFMGCNIAFAHVAGAIDRLRLSADDTGDRDVILWRQGGRACMSVPHVARHSPDGPEWGYTGSGPADAALSILTRVVGLERAEALYQRFKRDVIAHVPQEGGRFTPAFLISWARQQTND